MHKSTRCDTGAAMLQNGQHTMLGVPKYPQRRMTFIVLIVVVILSLVLPPISGEFVNEFKISETAEVGTTIGFIGKSSNGHQRYPSPPYHIVPVQGSGVDSDLQIESHTGEIKTKAPLDRESRSSYSLVAIPLSSNDENIRVTIEVMDENDNDPTFETPIMHIYFAENTPRDVKKTLKPAIDPDLDINNTQRYNIVSGNINNAFRVSSHRERDGVLYLDLQINGFLDRETTAFYSLRIEALDGGTPPRRGYMTVNITIQDINDNQPIFNQSRYFASVKENATVGTSVLQVLATDTDAGENGRITYFINRRQRDREGMFQIDPKTGVIKVNRPLDFETKDAHELAVVARDNGKQPLETTAFVSIRVTDVNDNQPTIDLIFLTDDASPKIAENAEPGKFVARISVNDPDSKEEYSNVNVTLQGGDGHFGLTTKDNIIYLVVVSKPLDREIKPNYSLVVIATDKGMPPLHATREFDLHVTDLNDNAPEFDQTVYFATVLEVADPGTSVFQLSALDLDEGDNALVSYSIRDTSETHSHWFKIDSRTGLITTKTHVDCETQSEPQITVVASDAGVPSLSSSATVKVTILDVNDNEPLFDQSFYNVSVKESEPVGNCVLKVSAWDADCGVNAVVNYTMGDGYERFKEFRIRPDTGDICISGSLDHETRAVYEFPVVATDRGGMSTTAMVKIQLDDINDNLPSFYPHQYNVSLREQHDPRIPVVVVVATDEDAGANGEVFYEIVSGNEDNFFRIEGKTGELFIQKPLSRSTSMYHIQISARDGTSLRSAVNAEVSISVIDTDQEPPIFEKTRYTFGTKENVAKGFAIGTVTATTNGAGEIRYSIYSGDPNGYFTIDSISGAIRTASTLDHESHPFVLLNVLATSGKPPTYGHTQVNISIWDVNDNAPEFDVSSVKISVPEEAQLNDAIYAAHATDHDSGNNGVIHYELIQNPDDTFIINEEQGILMLLKQLDYETVQKYTLIVRAYDKGSPSLSSNLTINLEVQDVNDNPPVFEKNKYEIGVLESLSANSQFLQVIANDRDTGNNARLTYSIKENNDANIFGVFPNSGSLYLKEGHVFYVEENMPSNTPVGRVSAEDKDSGVNALLRFSLLSESNIFEINSKTGEIVTRGSLDREDKPVYEVLVRVNDNGTPPREDKTSVMIHVTDVNDNAPTFIEPRERSISVREEQPAGTEVLQVRATDRDEGNNASITYSFISSEDSDDDEAFAINHTTGLITTTKVLDHDSKAVYFIVVMASDEGKPGLTAIKEIQINVLDINDNSPTFPTSSLTFKIKEGIPIGKPIGSVVTNDRDIGFNNVVKYTIKSGNINETFDIDRITGQIFAINTIDYEMVPQYILNVEAEDSSISLQKSVRPIQVKIEIIDINDQAPEFNEDPVLFSVCENLEIGSVIWNFTAIDIDTGSNGFIQYSLTKQTPKNVFKLDASNGMLTLMAPLDYEEYKEYILVVTARDQPRDAEEQLSSTVTARILIEDHNDNSPQFVSPGRVEVLEDEPGGYKILQVIATDDDSEENGRVTYIIDSGNDAGHFSLDYDSGVLTIAKQLDREYIDCFSLKVVASDHGKVMRSSMQEVEIIVEDVNDNAPQFSQPTYFANISEGSDAGTFVVRVTASDKDFGSNSNLTYVIPTGIGENKFRINPITGEIETVARLHRKEKEMYFLTVYVKDSAVPAKYDTSIVVVNLTDINDHDPEFRDSCYPLRVPENTDLSNIHTVVASDKDTEINGKVTYSITSGNFGNKFRIDAYTGVLSAQPLDREEMGKYFLMITAQDGGTPGHTGVCNMTITVEDNNDNDPEFDQNRYYITVSEDTPLDTTVLQVFAEDRDYGENARLTYSLVNETQWLFKINNETGIITTNGYFDREKQSHYVFEVRATDGGMYNARYQDTQIHVTISDVNDNKPVFGKYPFVVDVDTYVQPGKQISIITAYDIDEGLNSTISYNFVNEPINNKFIINSETGVIGVTSQLNSDFAPIFYLEVMATDKGTPPQSSTGLIEIRIGNKSFTPLLKFRNLTYTIYVEENAENGYEILQVTAFWTDNRNQRITYKVGFGNEDGTFEINKINGWLKVRNSQKLDFEVVSETRLIIVAEAEGNPSHYAYTTVDIKVIDQNDNQPRFTQDHYVSSVWEGNNKGKYVMRVSAIDKDNGANGKIAYHIVNGNHDNAFIIEPPFSGIVKTNIVLDREIRDSYVLTIIATDEGIPQLTGTCTLKINIIDMNDNQPTFPPHSVVQVSEGSEIGTVITTITANDVDTYPAITYNFASKSNSKHLFSIDKFTGKITLASHLDHESVSNYTLEVEASDEAHVTKTIITVQVTDENDNAPIFLQHAYNYELPEHTPIGTSILQVKAEDADSGDNAKVTYSLLAPPFSGFYIDENSGTIYTNATMYYNSRQPVIQLVAVAIDKGKPSLSGVAAVRIEITDVNNHHPKFSRNVYKALVQEDVPRGYVVIQVSASDVDESRSNRNIVYHILHGNDKGTFHISSSTGQIVVVGSLDREIQSNYELLISANDRGKPSHNATARVDITVEDVNDHAPKFNQTEFYTKINESLEVGKQVFNVSAYDEDTGLNAKIAYDITSGNDDQIFGIDPDTGVITLLKAVDYEVISTHRLIVSATDSNPHTPLSNLTAIFIQLEDVNDNVPEFPVNKYLGFIDKYSPSGKSIITARAFDYDKGKFGILTYSIVDGADRDKFKVESESGIIKSKTNFDFESHQNMYFILQATDLGGKSATVSVQIIVESARDFLPVFSKRRYFFSVPLGVKIGYKVGQVQAFDEDRALYGQVYYTLNRPSEIFVINSTSGEIYVQRTPKREENVQLEIIAKSGAHQTARTIVEVVIGEENTILGYGSHERSGKESEGLPGWAIGLIISLILFILFLAMAFLFIYRKQLHLKKPGMADQFDTSFDTIDIRPPPNAPADLSQYPPRYNDIPHYNHHGERGHHGNTTSEMSEQSHSASSGRGSADDNEDVEDEEIRMINEGPLIQQQKIRDRTGIHNSGLNEEDNISEMSIHNTQEYLARLGIDTTKSESTKGSQDLTQPMGSMHMFDDEGNGDNDGLPISNLLYAKLNEVNTEEDDSLIDGNRAFGFGDESQPSMTGSLSSIVHSEEELQGSYNWDYLLDWGPQYQPLAHVFSEIARLKDDSAPNQYSREPLKKTLNPQVKTVPPPLLTNVAPRSIAPVALNTVRTSQMNLPSLPRSPISHEASFTSPAMSPSFSPSLSPLATRSPSISPLMTPGAHNPAPSMVSQTSATSTPHHGRSLVQRSGPTGIMTGASSGSENELRL